jgi:hypothetical protein
MLKKPVEPKLSSGQINLMIQSILIHMDHFEILAAKIKPNLFLQSEAHYALLFDIVSKHVLESDLPPSIGDFIGALDAAPDKQVAESAKRIAIAAFSAQPSSHLTKKTFQLYAVRFAKERLLLSAQHKLTEVNNSAGITNDIFDYFSNDFITTAEYIETDSQINDDTFVPFQEGWNDKALFNRIPSGVEFIDYFTDGGWIKGLTYSLMGPFGSFKSTLARQLAVNLSRTYQALFDSGQDDRLGKVFYVCGEEGKSRVMMKILSYASNIPYFKLSEGQELSTIKNPSLRDISLNQTAGYISGEI